MKYTRSRRGSYLIEAVLVMPLIVIITVMMMCASLYMHYGTAKAAKMDQQARRQAGISSETVLYLGQNAEIKQSDSQFSYSDSFADGRKIDFNVSATDINECCQIWKR